MKFIIATGGTGGHLFPALRVAQELKGEGHDILFLGSFHRGRDQMKKSGFCFEDLGAKGFVGGSLIAKVQSMMAMSAAVFKAIRSLRKFRPDAVIGFGGYGAFPVVLSATLLRCPTLIHEQNVVPGRANALLAKFVQKIAVSFKKGDQYFNSRKVVFTGCPCHRPKENCDRGALLKAFRLEEGRATILVFGGSQGSSRINEAFIEAAKSLKAKMDFQVIHIVGERDYQKFQDRYNQLGIPFALFKFLDKMEEAYGIADLVISRSGAVTVSEIASFQLPSILIPYPFARGHQKENATVLCSAKAAQLIEEKDLSVLKLVEAVSRALEFRPNREVFKNICVPDATQRLAREALKLVQ